MAENRRKFLSLARQKLLHRLISGWKRRGTTLLQVGLDAGFSPEFFWEAGFDVTALDRSSVCLSAAREQTGPKVDYVCGMADSLPFDDGVFDYAVLFHRELTSGEGKAILEEALRVAVRGIIIMEWNAFSLAGAPAWASAHWEEGEECSSCASSPRAVKPWELYFMARRACSGRRISFFSSLPLWECTWHGERSALPAFVQNSLDSFNLFPMAWPFGSLMALRIDWAPVPMTPIGMLKSAAASLCPPAKRSQEQVVGRGFCPCEAERKENAQKRGK